MSDIKVANTFVKSLPGDPNTSNIPRLVNHSMYSFVQPKGMADPHLIIYSEEVAEDLGWTDEFCQSEAFEEMMTGNMLIPDSTPYAMCYGGHQFGHWAGQLGDGRAINLGEVVTASGHLNLQLKGAGPTPYSRTADGLAVLRSSVREFLCSEAMYHLGVPTTRALSLALTGEKVLRDMMYNGNAAYEQGAVVCRVAPSFIRFGNFEIFASRQDHELLKVLADYTISHYFPHLQELADRYLQMFAEVAASTCEMIVHWQRVGFVHGVMNTDNMSILGLTIDYGPYGWMDNYDPDWTPNTTDLPNKRYRFGNQPVIAQWNLLKLANALYPLIEDEADLKKIIQDFKMDYEKKYHLMMMSKLGLEQHHESDSDLIKDLENFLSDHQLDMTMFFRNIALIEAETSDTQVKEIIASVWYDISESQTNEAKIQNWVSVYQKRLSIEKRPNNTRILAMDAVNPRYVLRNYMAQMAIDKAEQGDYSLIHDLHKMLKRPYELQPEYEQWFAKRPDWARDKVGCSMLSCSS
ncbi:MAG: YdiU family protein [Saprospiraceae bacterium]